MCHAIALIHERKWTQSHFLVHFPVRMIFSFNPLLEFFCWVTDLGLWHHTLKVVKKWLRLTTSKFNIIYLSLIHIFIWPLWLICFQLIKLLISFSIFFGFFSVVLLNLKIVVIKKYIMWINIMIKYRRNYFIWMKYQTNKTNSK